MFMCGAPLSPTGKLPCFEKIRAKHSSLLQPGINDKIKSFTSFATGCQSIISYWMKCIKKLFPERILDPDCEMNKQPSFL